MSKLKSESQREREVQLYYGSWRVALGSSLNVALNYESIALADLRSNRYEPIVSSDKTLTAFAQLAVLRLNVKRAMVSLIDSSHQYILAEATRRNQDGELWLGATIIPRADAICEHGLSGDMIVPDCRHDARFQHRPYVRSEPGVRFYAGVPILSPAELPIGTYAVSDESPREGLTTEELHFMQETARGVMQHLEWARDRVDRFKGERIVRGLAAFIQGQSTADKDNKDNKDNQDNHHSRMSRMFHRAADILRESTLADGVALLRAGPSGHERRESAASGSPGADPDSSDLDTAPATRPCTILASSLASGKERADVELAPAMTVGTLERYLSLYPQGKALSFADGGAEITSGSDSTSEAEGSGAACRNQRVDHRELLARIPDAKALVFLPLFDHTTDRNYGGIFLWTGATGRLIDMDGDLPYLHTFSNSIMSKVARINTQRNEAAKTTFIASMSHELRSPLHGMLGAAEFLKDTVIDSHQASLVASIATCGRTLLDTLNHVLDYSKINRLGRTRMRRGTKQNKIVRLASDTVESSNLTAVVNLAVLVEDVVDAVTAGHTFKKLPIGPQVSEVTASTNTISADADHKPRTEGPVSVVLDIDHKSAYMVRTQPGALRRIVMNLLGNALKYTAAGYILLSLQAQSFPQDESKVDVVIRIVDTGKGISNEFLRDRLFVPFSQEDSFQPGTGLGLSIVKQIVDSLGGTIEIRSKVHQGTEVDVRLRLAVVADAVGNASSSQLKPDHEMKDVAKRTKGLQLTLLEATMSSKPPPQIGKQLEQLDETLASTCRNWFGMEVAREKNTGAAETDIYLFSEPPSVELLEERFKQDKESSLRRQDKPLIVVCLDAEEAASIYQNQSRTLTDLGMIVELIPQPCGPRKMAKTLDLCLRRKATNSSSSHAKEFINGPAVHLRGPPEAAFQQPARPTPLRRRTHTQTQPHTHSEKPRASGQQKNTPHVLVVDDNKINLQLLVMFMKKCGYTYDSATDGLEALNRFAEAATPIPPPPPTTDTTDTTDPDAKKTTKTKKGFDYVLMDISMPIMDGIESTRRIREFERERGLEGKKQAMILALTGLASEDARREATAAGVDVFLPKPVRFGELKELISGGGAG